MILAVGDLEDNSVSLVNAGHFPPAILVNASGVGFVEQRGKPVGLFDKVKYDARVVRLDVGDRLVMFSDGLLDAMDNESLSEKEERLLQAAVYPEMDLIWQSLGINEGAVPDDMTCLTVRRER
jgi:serine phosphatase RsbU (regulator of sigma subunit)